ncbi:hypothetical protein ACFWX6_31240 [Amycolatopsis sp. NPDC059019]|uniref:hypothetical protein n=1 Tax=unclassified Amycolatopsis TaxID=2618356 RepID=UPI00366CC937
MEGRIEATGHGWTVGIESNMIMFRRLHATHEQTSIPLRDVVRVRTRPPRAWFKGEFDVLIHEMEPTSVKFTRRQAPDFEKLYSSVQAALAHID